MEQRALNTGGPPSRRPAVTTGIGGAGLVEQRQRGLQRRRRLHVQALVDHAVGRPLPGSRSHRPRRITPAPGTSPADRLRSGGQMHIAPFKLGQEERPIHHPADSAVDIDTDTITASPVCQSPVSSNTISVVEIGAPSTAAATAPIPASA